MAFLIKRYRDITMKPDNPEGIIIRVATPDDQQYAVLISDETESSAIKRGSGIAKRPPEYICQKMLEGKAVIAITEDGKWVGFSYIEIWAKGEFVSNSGLIVHPDYRGMGVASGIKQQIFNLARKKYPTAQIFSITTGLAIMKMNAALGFDTVTFNEITHDEQFWKGCRSCVNFSILESKQYKNCLCTAMLFTPQKELLV